MTVRTGSARVAILLALSCATLGACKKKPEGQVVATVNGDEITRRDLVSEFAASGGKNEADLAAVQPALLQSLVTRKLLVQEAERTNLDKNPQYLAMSQRGQDALLAQMLAQTWTSKVKPPRPQDLPAFIAANPLMFGQRKVLLCNTITTATTSISREQLQKLSGSDAIEAWLKANKKPYRRGDKPVDTLELPQELSQAMIAKLGQGPLVIDSGGTYSIVLIKGVREAPVPQEQWNAVARNAIMRRQQTQTSDDQIKRLRASADISYLPGFAPPPQPKAAAK